MVRIIKRIKNAINIKINVLLKLLIKVYIKDTDQSIDYLLDNKCSVSRFGDGELLIINNKDIGFQDKNEELSNRLKEILKNDKEGIMICVPYPLVSTQNLNKKARYFWENDLKSNRYNWYKNMNLKKTYYNTQMTRLYMDYEDKSLCKNWFSKLKKVWHDRDLVIIEGEKSRLGVGNDLFNNSRSIKRILAPSENAYDKYDELLIEASKIDKNKLILIALGPTATVLAYDLSRMGYQAIDIGHIDIEYEWYLKGVTNKVNIENKYVNEVNKTNKFNENLPEKYYKEIYKIIT